MTEQVAFLSISVTTISVKLITSAAVPTFGGYSWKCCLADFIANDTTYITNIPALVGRLVLNSKLVANRLAVSPVTSTTVLHAERIHANCRRVKANCRVETLVAIFASCCIAKRLPYTNLTGATSVRSITSLVIDAKKAFSSNTTIRSPVAKWFLSRATRILRTASLVILAEVAGRSLVSNGSIAVGLGVGAAIILGSKSIIVLAEVAGRSLVSNDSIAVGLGIGAAIILGSKSIIVLAEVAGCSLVSKGSIAVGLGVGAAIILGSKRVVVLAEEAGRSLVSSNGSIAVGLGVGAAIILGSKRVVVLAEEAGRSLVSNDSIAVGLGIGAAIILGSK
jgi:hypothetical protein